MIDDWSQVITCPVCGSEDVDGVAIDDGIEMPNPDDEDRPLIGYDVVSFVCLACGHRWVDGESDPAGGHSQRDQGDDQQGGAKSGDSSGKPF